MQETPQSLADHPWRELDLISFDTETSGKYPLSAEICELAAVKWRGGQIVDRFSTLIKPTAPMGSEVIAIHGITNEMVENSPRMRDKIGEFAEFIKGGVMLAHHAPFDLGFVSLAMEDHGISLPTLPALCTSLMSRKLFPESANHRLQTLIGFFKLSQGSAHRAEDDAVACLGVGLKCLEKLGEDATLAAAFAAQGGELTWQRFSMAELVADPKQGAVAKTLIEAVREQKVCLAAYSAGSKPGEARRLQPQGLVRSLDGDFLVAYDERDQRSKRYLVEKITSATIV